MNFTNPALEELFSVIPYKNENPEATFTSHTILSYHDTDNNIFVKLYTCIVNNVFEHIFVHFKR